MMMMMSDDHYCSSSIVGYAQIIYKISRNRIDSTHTMIDWTQAGRQAAACPASDRSPPPFLFVPVPAAESEEESEGGWRDAAGGGG
jgi:hypothetical protein